MTLPQHHSLPTDRAAEQTAPTSVTPLRGLLFDAADLPRIRTTVLRPEFSEFWNHMTKVDFAADEKFLNEELHTANHIVHMLRAQVIMQRSAFVHRLFPDPQHLALARTALARLLAYPRWDWLRDSQNRPVSVMRGAGTCIAFALVSEWLADDLSSDEQLAITAGMSQEGGPSCYRGLHDMTHHPEAGPWSLEPGELGLPPIDVARWPRILDDTNLRIICTAGLAAATCHQWGRHPEAAQWLELTRHSLRLYAARLPSDGSFPEGLGYWDYTFSHYCFAVEILRRKLAVDERALVDFPAQARYALEMTMPTAGHADDCISIGDSASAAGAVPLMWIAREFRDSGAQHLALRPGSVRANWNTCWAAIWFDPSVTPRRPADAHLDRCTDLGIVISRTGWEEDDTVVTLRSGGPVNHEHADRNSVLFTAHGERLLNDPIHAAYSPKDPKWLLRQTEAHTSVLINGRGHIYHDGHDGTNASPAAATIQAYRTGLNWMVVTSDAADAYRRAGLPAGLVQRTLVYLKPGVLVIFDRVLLTEALPVSARFQVFNADGHGRVATADGEFTIERPQASLHARVVTAAGCGLATGKLALPESSGIYPFAEIRSAPAHEHTLITLCTTAPRGEAHGRINVSHLEEPAPFPVGPLTPEAPRTATHRSRVSPHGGDWEITGSHRGQHINVKLSPSPTGVPEVRC